MSTGEKDTAENKIQEDLPRFTKLMLDGKAIYIHMANFKIIDKDLPV